MYPAVTQDAPLTKRRITNNDTIPSTSGPKSRRLVVVSNRVAVSSESAQTGGLAVAVSEALEERGGLWFGWNGAVDPNAASQHVQMSEADGIACATVALTPEERDGYYLGFANSCLWPALHYRLDLMQHDAQMRAQYDAVNARLASLLYPMLEESDLVWVHDFHLIPLAEELRKLHFEGAIGFFLHTPFPSPDIFASIPGHRSLTQALMAYDVIGFQTSRDRLNFVQHATLAEGARETEDGRMQAFGRSALTAAFPIGIDIAAAEHAAAAPGAHARRPAEQVLIGVDRLDYTKGIPERLLAFEQFLERSPHHHGHVRLIQIAPSTREGVACYAELSQRVQRLVGRINGRFGTVDWAPVTFINRAVPRYELFRLYRTASVGLVTPLRDGMNLVAKEFVAAQDARNPGVLILSSFAGAAEEMKAALQVNPHNTTAMSTAIAHALDMPLSQRQRRHKWLHAQVARSDVRAWRAGFLQALSAAVEMPLPATEPVMAGAA